MKSLNLLLCVILLLGMAVSESSTVQQTHEWRFRALLDDKPIGYHRFALSDNGRERVLESQAQFEVKFLFIKAYGYDHNVTERWAGDCLQSINATTDDNGTRHAVQGFARGKHFVVTTQKNRARLPHCVMTFAYWNPVMLEKERLLNAQTGTYVNVQTTFAGREMFPVGNRNVLADRYRLQADGLKLTLWYAATDRRWLGLESLTEGGYTLRYELDTTMLPDDDVRYGLSQR